jgi:single-strand DNA-binding protein
MNKVILMGRLTRNPDVRYSNSANGDNMCIARYTLAVDRRFSRRNSDGDNQQNADFISCVAFGKQGEFAEKYLKQGTKIAATGRIQTGSYTNKEGQKVYTTEVVIEEQEFAESKNANSGSQGDGGYVPQSAPSTSDASAEDFMNIPAANDDLPFK